MCVHMYLYSYKFTGYVIMLKSLSQTHSNECPNALRRCEHCQKEIPAFKVLFVDYTIVLYDTIMFVAYSLLIMLLMSARGLSVLAAVKEKMCDLRFVYNIRNIPISV